MKQRQRFFYTLLIPLLFVGLLSGCTKESSSDHQRLSQKDLDALSAMFAEDVNVGKFEPSDTDEDGVYDKFTLTFKREEVEDHLFLDKSVVYERAKNGFDGTIMLVFENTGDHAKKYRHIEKIPKSFASHVDNLVFSTPPDEIINADPEVSWIVEVMERNVEKIAIQAKIAAASAAVEADPGKALALLSGMSKAPTEKMRVAGQDAAIGVILNRFSDFVSMAALNKCAGFKGPLWNSCLMSLMLKSPTLFTESDCEKIDKAYPDATNNIEGSVLYGMCRAIMTEDSSACHDNTDNWKDVDLCKHALFTAVSRNCTAVKDKQKKDECFYNAAVKSDSMYGCEGILNKTSKAGCLAEVTQESAYCEDIDDKDAKKYCCDKIVDDSARNRCYTRGQKQQQEEGKKEEASCESMSSGSYKKSCWRSLARKNCDVDVCITNFERTYDKNECIEGVARKCGVGHCLAMEDSKTAYNRVSCIYKIAKDKKDCALIGDEKYDNMALGRMESKKTCLERFGKN